MFNHLLTRALVLAVSGLWLTGCGGGGTSDTPAPIANPAPPPSSAPPIGVVGSGLISKFGADFSTVTIGGQEFNTTSADLIVTIDGQPATLSDLHVGNRVDVRALQNAATSELTASTISDRDDLKGPILAGSIDFAAQRLVVLGQTVQVSGSTLFDDDISPRSLEGLADGEIVEVSGLRDASGVIAATRIERKTGQVVYEVHGAVSSLDVTSATFRINALTVDFSAATLRDLPGAVIANGQHVEVKGRMLNAAGALVAFEVEGENPAFQGDDGDTARVEGYVTRFVSASDFDVAGRPVRANDQTIYERGTVADLSLNARLEAEGTLDSLGVLVATKIQFEIGDDQANVEIEAPVDSVDAAAGIIVVLGIPVSVRATTRIEDSSDADLEPFGLSDINSGDFVELRGFEDPIGSGNVVAVRLERDDPDDEIELQGAVESLERPTLTILGVTINTFASTRFEGLADQPLTADDFFDQVAVGTVVKAEGLRNGDGIDADEVEFED